MRILFPCGLFYPSKLGGPANTLYWLAKGLVKKGYSISVVSTKNHIDEGLVEEDQWTSIDGIRVRYCTSRSKFPLRIIWHAAREMNHSDMVIFSSVCYLPNFPLALKARLRGKKILWSPRGELLDNALQGNIVKKLYFKILKLILNQHVLFHATSEEEMRSVKCIFGEDSHVVVIPNLIEVPSQELRNENIQPYLLYVGRIAPIKALDNLINGLSLAPSFMKSDYVLKIVGGVERQFEKYYSELQELVRQLRLESKILFVGQINGKEKYKTYANAKFTFLVSHSENFGNVVIESLSQGTPVIASIGTPWKTLETNNAGCWIGNSPDEIALCVDKILSLSESEYIMKRNSASKLAKQYDVYNNIGEWQKVIEKFQF